MARRRRRWLGGAAALALLAAAGIVGVEATAATGRSNGPRPQHRRVPASPAQGSRLYVAAELAGSVQPIETPGGQPGQALAGLRFPVALAVGAPGPGASSAARGGQVSGSRAGQGDGVLWVADALDDTVLPVSLSDSRIGSPVPVGHGPVSMAVSARKGLLLVACSGANELVPVDMASMTPEPAVPVGQVPTAVVVSPDGSTAWVSNGHSNDVTPVDLARRVAGPPIPAGEGPEALALGPGGRTLYVADGRRPSVVPIDTQTRQAGAAIQLPRLPAALAVSPDGRTLYVALQNTSASGAYATRQLAPSSVLPVSTATHQVGPAIPVGRAPDALAFGPGGGTLYVANFLDDNLTPISTADDRPGSPIPVAAGPAALAAVS